MHFLHVYRPPSASYRPPSASSKFFDHFEKLIKATDDENKEIYLLEDLNCVSLKADENSNFPTKKIKSLQYELYQLSQQIDKPTRITMTTKSLVDHIVTNAPEKNSNTGVIHTGISDHSLIFAIAIDQHLSWKSNTDIICKK